MIRHSRNTSPIRPRHRSRPTLDRLEDRLQPNSLGGLWDDLALGLPSIARPQPPELAPATEAHAHGLRTRRDTSVPPRRTRFPVPVPRLTLSQPQTPTPNPASPGGTTGAVMAWSSGTPSAPSRSPVPVLLNPAVLATGSSPLPAPTPPSPSAPRVTASTATPSLTTDGGYTLTNWGPYGSGATAIAMWTVPNSTTQRIVTAGLEFGSTSNTNSIAVTRYNTDGTFDTSFGSGGVASNVLPNDPEGLSAMALQPNGAVVVAGHINASSNTKGDVLVARYTANGALDTTFNGTGWVSTDINRAPNAAYAVGLQSTGKIIAAGYTVNSQGYDDSVILRYTSAGKLDSGSGGFGQAGKGGSALGYTIMSMGTAGPYDQINALAIQPDDKIVTVGSDIDGNAVNSQLTLMRFTASGSPDPTFNEGSPVLLPPSTPGWSAGFAVALQTDGKIVVAGDSGTYDAQGIRQEDFLVARFNPNGTPDTTFNNGTGSIVIPIPSWTYNQAHGVAIDSYGNIVVGGYLRQTVTSQSSTYGTAVARLTPNGTLDTNFGTNGVKTGAVLTTSEYDVSGLAIANDGSYYLAGDAQDPTSGIFDSTLLVHFLP